MILSYLSEESFQYTEYIFRINNKKAIWIEIKQLSTVALHEIHWLTMTIEPRLFPISYDESTANVMNKNEQMRKNDEM